MNAAGELRDAALQTNVEVTDISKQLVANSLEAANAAAVVQEQKDNVARQQEATRLAIANRIGTNANDASWFAGAAADRVKAADAAMQKKLEVIQGKQSINFIDNPLGYLYAQATVDGDIGEYNGFSRQKDLAVKTTQELETMTSNAFLNNNALVQTTTDASIAASKILSAHVYQQEAGKVALEGLRTNLQGLQIASNATMDQTRLMFEGNNAIMREKQYAISLAGLQMQKENFNLGLEAKKQKMEEGEFVEKLAKQGYFTLTGGTEMPDSYRRDLQKMYNAKIPQVVAWVESGLAGYMADPTGAKPVFSNSPFDVTTMATSGMINIPNSSQKQVLDRLVEYRREFENPAVQAKMQLDPKDKTARERAFNGFVKEQSNREQQNVQSSSVYAIPSLVSIAAANKNVTTLPVWQNVLAPLTNAGAKLDDPTFVIGSVIDGVKSGKISYQDAVSGIPAIYGAGVSLNNQARNFIAMGMAPATTYVTGVQAPGEFGKTAVNLADQKAVSVFLNRELSRLAIQGARIPGLPQPNTPWNRLLGNAGKATE